MDVSETIGRYPCSGLLTVDSDSRCLAKAFPQNGIIQYYASCVNLFAFFITLLYSGYITS